MPTWQTALTNISYRPSPYVIYGFRFLQPRRRQVWAFGSDPELPAPFCLPREWLPTNFTHLSDSCIFMVCVNQVLSYFYLRILLYTDFSASLPTACFGVSAKFATASLLQVSRIFLAFRASVYCRCQNPLCFNRHQDPHIPFCVAFWASPSVLTEQQKPHCRSIPQAAWSQLPVFSEGLTTL